MRRLLALILLTLLLEACGNKGPLFLPAEDGKPRRTESSPGVRIPPQAP
ncbi:MAG: lipoprotein [Burkholderiales bacterium]